MFLRLNERPTIDNLRNYPADVIEQLSALLATGAHATADEHRKDFYEVEFGARIYYLHVSPASGHVILLGSWPAQNPADIEVAALHAA